MPAAPTEAPPPMDEPTPPGALVFPGSTPRGEAPIRDDQTIPASNAEPTAEAEAEGGGGNPLPKALTPEGSPPPGSSGAKAEAADPFVIQPDRFATGKGTVKLSVEVRAGSVINLGKEATIRIVVHNDGTNDAFGVSVVYLLPESLQFVASESPEIKDAVNPQIYTWNKPMIAAGGEWSIGVKVLAKGSKACEHVATVAAKTGSKAAMLVQEPKLKVEAIASPGRILKGGQVKYEITVSNLGTGPAHDVNIQAKLSDGLRLGQDDLVEQVIDVLKAGERRQLDPLIVDTVAGGVQGCTIDVRSPDVNAIPEDHHVVRTVAVTRPELAVELSGPEKRVTGQSGDYKLTVVNTGDAPAKGVAVSVAMPQQGGKLPRLPTGAKFNVKERKLVWTIAQLEPNQTIENKFPYETSTPGFYRYSAEAVSGPLRVSKQLLTEVVGIADLDLQLTQTDRVIDVGKTTYYDFVIKNFGTKEATKLQLSGTLVNLKVKQQFSEDSPGEFVFKPETDKQPAQFIFPEIPRLGPGQSITLSLEVEALRGGKASASVSLAHDEMGADENAKIIQAITTTVTDLNRPSRSPGATP